MDRQIGLAVAIQIERAHLNAHLHWVFEDAG
jgi:hypothetical protein